MTSINDKFTSLGNSIKNLVGTRADKNLSNITSSGENVITGLAAKKDLSNITTAGENVIKELAGSSRNIGEIVASTVPLTDAGLHLLDGSLIQGSGIYSAFVTYIAGLYADDPTASYFAQPTTESEVSWTQPTLTANGTMGGDEFACSASSFSNVYRAFNSTNTENVYGNNTNTETITFYNPNKLKVTSIVWNVFNADRNPINYTVQGSTDGSTYTSIITNQTASAGASTTMDLSSNTDFYNYYKIIVNSFNTGQGNLKTLVISATQLISESKTAEQVWQEQVATYGVCGKFVYDSTNNTVRLPKITGIIEGTTDVSALGDLVEAGLPNITGSISNDVYPQPSIETGAFYRTSLTSSYRASGLSTSTASGIQNFDASRSSSIYGNSTTVQPQTIKAFYYIVIATSTKTDIQVDIDEIATDLNGKADVDLTNITLTSNFATVLNTAGIRTVVETYVNGTSWYRVYSDGWCEQGGKYTKSTGGLNAATINLLKNFLSTDYLINATAISAGATVSDCYDLQINSSNKTTSSFSIGMGANSAYWTGAYWRACGYIN